MNLIISTTSLSLFALGVAVSVCHIWLAVWGFQVERPKGPARGMFSLTLLIMAWSVLTLSVGHAGLWELHPWLIVCSPIVSGFAPPAFFIFCASVTSPEKAYSRWWLMAGFLGSFYSYLVLTTEGGAEQVVSYTNHQVQAVDSLFTQVFIVHTAVMGLFLICTSIMVTKAYLAAKTVSRKHTLRWLLMAILVGVGLVISGNIMPLLGITDSVALHSTVTLPMTFLAYRGLKSHTQEIQKYSLTEEQAQKELHATIGRVVRGVAHEINNMLTSIVGSTELIRMSSHDRATLASVDRICLASTKTGALLDRMVMFSGRGDKSIRTERVTEIISSALSDTTKDLAKASYLSGAIEADLPPLALRENEIREVIDSLVRNGFDSGEGREVKVTVEALLEHNSTISKEALGAEIDGSTTIHLMVADNGNGMTRSVLKKSIEPFFTTRKSSMGFGLTRVFASVQQCHGAMLIESKIGEGTTVHCWFPATKVFTPAPPKVTIKDATTVLIVEDEPAVLQVLDQMIALMGYKTLLCESAEKALDISELPKDIAIAFIDVNLPGKSGIELTSELISGGFSAPIFLMSGDEPGDIGKVQTGGVQVKFIRKPISLNTLQEIIAGAVDES